MLKLYFYTLPRVLRYSDPVNLSPAAQQPSVFHQMSKPFEICRGFRRKDLIALVAQSLDLYAKDAWKSSILMGPVFLWAIDPDHVSSCSTPEGSLPKVLAWRKPKVSLQSFQNIPVLKKITNFSAKHEPLGKFLDVLVHWYCVRAYPWTTIFVSRV